VYDTSPILHLKYFCTVVTVHIQYIDKCMSIYDVLLRARRLGLSVEAILMFFMLSVHAKCSLAFFC